MVRNRNEMRENGGVPFVFVETNKNLKSISPPSFRRTKTVAITHITRIIKQLYQVLDIFWKSGLALVTKVQNESKRCITSF